MKTSRTFIFLGLAAVVLLGSCEKDALYLEAPENPDKNELLILVNEVRNSGCNCGDDYYPPANDVV